MSSSVARVAEAHLGIGVVAVVVTYQPDREALTALLEALAAQVDSIVVVDNASRALPELVQPAQLIRLTRNLGVAAAQNIGLQAATAAGAQAVLLLDQDSIPGDTMMTELLAALQAATKGGVRVAAVGPQVVDAQGRIEGFVHFRRGRYEAVTAGDGQAWVDCDMLIASGSLIPLAALQEIGNMDEQLFIDKVDTEWSLRAAARGYSLIGAPRARLYHRLGVRQVRLWFFGWRELALHSPFRYYYMVRNGMLLRRLPHTRGAWRRADCRQLLSILLYFGMLAPGRWASLRMMARGLHDGLRGVDGPLP